MVLCLKAAVCRMEAVIDDLFWLSDVRCAPFMLEDQPGPERRDIRQIVSGILRVLTSGSPWRDCPTVLDPAVWWYS